MIHFKLVSNLNDFIVYILRPGLYPKEIVHYQEVNFSMVINCTSVKSNYAHTSIKHNYGTRMIHFVVIKWYIFNLDCVNKIRLKRFL